MKIHPLVIDVAATELGDADRRRLQHPLVGGMILFARNWSSRSQLVDLCREIKALRPDLLILVDHEGGRVQRFRSDGFTHLPPMRALGWLWQQDRMQAQDTAAACGYVLASELRACGVDFSFTPVLDLDWGSASVVGDRALHRSPRVVTMLARGLMQGLREAGMGHCGKHFPGHGHARTDSHHGVPRDRRALHTILRADARPYQWLGAMLAAVMPAHVVYPRVDARPAGFSRIWLQQILRDQLGHVGAIVSDDLSMAGARQIEGRTLAPAQAVLAALEAGCDLALLCNQSLGNGQVIDEVLVQLEQALQAGRWRPDPKSEPRRLALLPRGPQLSWQELMQLPRYRRARSLCRDLAQQWQAHGARAA